MNIFRILRNMGIYGYNLTRLIWLFYCISHLEGAKNLALYKPANQTGTFGDLVASRAVDGRYGSQLDQDSCAHPDNREQNDDGSRLPAEWWVDLEKTYLVDNVTIHNTYNVYGHKRLEEFAISVGMTLDNRTDCGTHTELVPVGGNVTILCITSTKGRYVHFRRTGGFEPNLVTLCEVEVHGRDMEDTVAAATPSPTQAPIETPSPSPDSTTHQDGKPQICQESCKLDLIPWILVGVLSAIILILLIIIIVGYNKLKRQPNKQPADNYEYPKDEQTGFDLHMTGGADYADRIAEPEQLKSHHGGNKHKTKDKNQQDQHRYESSTEQYESIVT